MAASQAPVPPGLLAWMLAASRVRRAGADRASQAAWHPEVGPSSPRPLVGVGPSSPRPGPVVAGPCEGEAEPSAEASVAVVRAGDLNIQIHSIHTSQGSTLEILATS